MCIRDSHSFVRSRRRIPLPVLPASAPEQATPHRPGPFDLPTVLHPAKAALQSLDIPVMTGKADAFQFHLIPDAQPARRLSVSSSRKKYAAAAKSPADCPALPPKPTFVPAPLSAAAAAESEAEAELVHDRCV